MMMVTDVLIDVTDLHYRYEDGTAALHGINLRVSEHERIALVGPNGSGKSTLLMCLSGLFHCTGFIRFRGERLTKSQWKKNRDRIGLVFQDPDDQLFMPVLHDDLAFGPINLGLSEAEVHQRVHEVAEQMGLASVLGRAPHHLSMGQKRSAAIAAVLAMRPAVLLLDEPTSNLDPRSRKRLITVLKGLDNAMLIASHDMALVSALCPRMVVIDEGHIVVDGPTADILSDQPLLEEHGLQ